MRLRGAGARSGNGAAIASTRNPACIARGTSDAAIACVQPSPIATPAHPTSFASRTTASSPTEAGGRSPVAHISMRGIYL